MELLWPVNAGTEKRCTSGRILAGARPVPAVKVTEAVDSPTNPDDIDGTQPSEPDALLAA